MDHPETRSIPQAILENPPFQNLLEITEMQALPYGISGRAYKVINSNGKAFKLRICATVDQARDIEKNIEALSNIFPEFHGRDRQYLLLEYLSGLALKKQEFSFVQHRKLYQKKELCYQIGQLMSLANLQIRTGDSVSLDRFVLQTLDALAIKNRIPATEKTAIQNRYLNLRKRIDYQFCLDLYDTIFTNFHAYSSRLYYVDEEGIGQIKGMGLVNCLRHLTWYSDTPTRFQKWLLAGYMEGVSDSTSHLVDYLLLVAYYTQISRIHSRLGREKSIQRDLSHLRNLHQPVNQP